MGRVQPHIYMLLDPSMQSHSLIMIHFRSFKFTMFYMHSILPPSPLTM